MECILLKSTNTLKSLLSTGIKIIYIFKIQHIPPTYPNVKRVIYVKDWHPAALVFPDLKV